MKQSVRSCLLVVLSALTISTGVSAVHAATISFSGSGVDFPSSCTPSPCIDLNLVADPYTVNGDSGWTFFADGRLVGPPVPTFPPSFLGSGIWSLTKDEDSLVGSWTNVFTILPPPPGCSGAPENPLCFSAVSIADFVYVIESGSGIYSGATGTGTSRVIVFAGFPPGNIANPAAGVPFTEEGTLHVVPEPATLGLLSFGMAVAVGRMRLRRRDGAYRNRLKL